jgi:ADP-heptose:LPS heptosyltransferase
MKKVCGLSWYSKADRTGVTRSVDLLELFNHIDPTEYTFVSLQYGDVADQIADLKAKKGVEIVCVPEVDNFQDLDGFAALVDACDVVLTIDNTTVHLAGALNKKTLVMLPDVPDWRWMLDRDDSPWYPSIRLLRQELRGDWRAVFQRVGAALAEPLGQPV